MAKETAPTREERRAKREERRVKQRAANVGRAAKMQTARLAWESEDEPADLDGRGDRRGHGIPPRLPQTAD